MVKISFAVNIMSEFEQKDIEIFLAGQAVQQMSQISCKCTHELLNIFEDPAYSMLLYNKHYR